MGDITLVPTSIVPHLKYPFSHFNPVQSQVMAWRDQDVNLVCASPTGSGKTEMAELVMDDTLARGRKAIYAAPMKAIAQEKKGKWTASTHGFVDRRIAEVTGDHRMTEKRIEELTQSDIVVMTTEALDARCRRMEAEKNAWLLGVGVLVVDEVHLLAFEVRGDRLESSLMRFTHYNPGSRLVFLSGTVSNYEELGRWATSLNGKKTQCISSDYRPCPLKKHYVAYGDGTGVKYQALSKLLKEHKKDRFIIFVATKPDGRKLVELLKKEKYKVDFHNADRNLENREVIESAFREGDLDHLISTSTLAYGVNLPARRVVVYGVTRTGNMVHPIDIHQECGRAGRMGFDPEGDAYIFIGEKNFDRYKERIEAPCYVESQMPKPKTLSFHIISEIEQGNVKTAPDVVKWFKRSLSAFQGKGITNEIIMATVGMLEQCKAVQLEHGMYRCLPAGRVASWFYHSPFDVACWRDNFAAIFRRTKDPDDIDLAWAISMTDSAISKGWPVKNEATDLYEEVCDDRGYSFNSRVVSKMHMTHMYIAGKELDEAASSRVYQEIRKDADRMVDTLKALSEMTGLFDPGIDFWETLSTRLETGVGREMLPLIDIKGVGRVRARKLFGAGIRSLHDICNDRIKVEKILGPNVGYAVYQSAMKIIENGGGAKEDIVPDVPGDDE